MNSNGERMKEKITKVMENKEGEKSRERPGEGEEQII